MSQPIPASPQEVDQYIAVSSFSPSQLLSQRKLNDQIMTNVRNARLVWGYTSMQYKHAVQIAIDFIRSHQVDDGGLEAMLGQLTLESQGKEEMDVHDDGKR